MRRPPVRGLLIAFLATGVVQVLNFISGVLIARLLGPIGRGEVSQIIAWFSFISPVAVLGINDAVTYFRSREPSRSPEIMAAAFELSLGTILLGMSLSLIVILTALKNLNSAAVWIFFLLFIPLNHILYLMIAYLQSDRDEISFNILRSMHGMTYVCSLVVLGVMGVTSTFAVICAYLSGFLTSVIFGLTRYRRGGDRLTRPSAESRLRILKFGIPLVMQRLAVVCRDNLDKMVLPFFIATAAFGHYVVASSVAYLIFIVGMTIELVGFPALVRATSDEERRRTAETLVALTFWMLCIASVALIALRQPIVHFIFGARYDASAGMVPGFVIAGALQALRLVFGTAFKGFGRPKALAGIEFTSAATMIIILFGFAGRLGAEAGILSHVISSTLAWLIAMMLAVRLLGLSPIRLFVPHRDALVKIWDQMRLLLRSWRAFR
jgi:O-antigen/teichoic acid export membrane protein